MDSLSLSVHALLKMSRVDLARQELARMKSIEDDATLTVLAEAWVDCYLVCNQSWSAAAVSHAQLTRAFSVPLLGARAAGWRQIQ